VCDRRSALRSRSELLRRHGPSRTSSVPTARPIGGNGTDHSLSSARGKGACSVPQMGA
jgi:hypothetical protein